MARTGMGLSIHVQFFSIFRQLTGGTESISVALPEEANLRDLLTRLGEVYGNAFQKAVLLPDGTGLAHGTTVLLNGRNVLTPQGLDTRLQQGDCLAILISIGGG